MKSLTYISKKIPKKYSLQLKTKYPQSSVKITQTSLYNKTFKLIDLLQMDKVLRRKCNSNLTE